MIEAVVRWLVIWLSVVTFPLLLPIGYLLDLVDSPWRINT